MSRPKIKIPPSKQGRINTSSEPVDYNKKPLVFSLERVQDGDYCFSKLDQADKAQFAEAIFKRRALTWNQINQADRHGLGHEKIPKAQIKAAIPKFITEDKDSFMVFRFSGLKPMVGYRVNDVFYVLWFDHNFSLYPHGS